jgi:hypothetical protein
MTTITTVEELEALDSGTTISYRNANGEALTATRSTGGFTTLGATLPTTYFTGTVAAGRVTVGPLFNVGDVWRLNGMDRLIIGAPTEGDQQVHCIADNYGTPAFFAYDPSVRLGERVEPSESNARLRAMAQLGLSYVNAERARLAERARRRTTGTVDEGSVRRRALEEMRDYIVEVWDGNSFTEEEVNDIFDHFGLDNIARPREDVEVTVSFSGTTRLDLCTVEEWVAEGRPADVDEDDLTVRWTWTTTTTREVDYGACACGELDSEDYSALLDDEGIAYEDYSTETSCSNCY